MRVTRVSRCVCNPSGRDALSRCIILALWAATALVGNTSVAVEGAGGERLRGLYYEPEADPTAPLVARMAIQLVGDTETEVVPWDRPFRSGDRIRFEFSSNSTGYAYVLSEGADGRWTQIFPADGEQLAVVADVQVLVPAAGSFRFDEATGEEQVTILVSPTPLAQGAIGEALELTHLNVRGDGVATTGTEAALLDLESASGVAEPTTAASPTPPPTSEPPASDDASAGDRTGRTVDAPDATDTSSTGRIVNIALRGLTYDPPADEADPYIYFQGTSGGPNGASAVQFTLKHE